jgi:hypothetical protein
VIPSVQLSMLLWLQIDGRIDEFQTTGAAQSGFGFETLIWCRESIFLIQLRMLGRIDLHMRADAGGTEILFP